MYEEINENAKESLASINEVMSQTRKAVASTYANPLLILWGILWVASFMAAQFYIVYAHYIFWGMSMVGGVGSFMIIRNYNSRPFVKSSTQKSWRLFWFWSLLFVYTSIWLAILSPFSGLQLNAVLATAGMFGYIVIGLWLNSYFMVWLGLTVTATTLIGFFFLPHYYCLWMAVTGGGAILFTGLYIRLRWR